jgi:hypothetical protein
MSYHLSNIPRGTFGELSKIQEELLEAMDADDQGCSLMILQELSDLIGAVRGYLATHHPHTTLQDLIKMSEITQRAFVKGHRVSDEVPVRGDNPSLKTLSSSDLAEGSAPDRGSVPALVGQVIKRASMQLDDEGHVKRLTLEFHSGDRLDTLPRPDGISAIFP